MYRTHTPVSAHSHSPLLWNVSLALILLLSFHFQRSSTAPLSSSSLPLFTPSTWHISNCNSRQQEQQQKQQLGRVTARRLTSLPAACCCNSNAVYSIKNFADRVMSSRSTATTTRTRVLVLPNIERMVSPWVYR